MTRLRMAREARGYTLQQLAAEAQVSEPWLCDLERGMRPVLLEKLDRVADALDMEIGQVFAAPLEDDRLPAELTG